VIDLRPYSAVLRLVAWSYRQTSFLNRENTTTKNLLRKWNFEKAKLVVKRQVAYITENWKFGFSENNWTLDITLYICKVE
jgi:hypothetical protein